MLQWCTSPQRTGEDVAIGGQYLKVMKENNVNLITLQNKNTLLRKEADDTFYVLLGMQCITGYRRFFIWMAVRTFGWLYV